MSCLRNDFGPSEEAMRNASEQQLTSECAAKNEGYDVARFALVVYVGTPIAFVGIFFNAILLVMFSSKEHLRHSFYLLVLAIFDMMICVIYIPFFTIDALAIFQSIETLHHIWHSYVMQLYGLSRVVQFASTYVVLCATIERFVYVSGIQSLNFLITDRGRGATVAVVLLVVLILRVPAFFDYSIVYENRCPPFQDYMFVPYLTAYDDYIMYNFYVMTILQIFLPFVLLFVLNIVIILLTRRRLYQTAYGQHLVEMPRISLMLRKESINKNRMGRNELKYATWTMVAIVFTYLICNSFSLFISVMENVFSDSPILVNADGSSTQFYTITADLISILVALNSLLRLVIYLLCNPQFRLRLTRKFLPSSLNAKAVEPSTMCCIQKPTNIETLRNADRLKSLTVGDSPEISPWFQREHCLLK
ncbi:Rhodopsin, GQ-coupled [Toxocara canis]|uniref:Rhodopsin, GQ-coupled n=1 Tax=Toxocara canis TaxID=6265 RepID=A0A0B2VJG9_TOXCA|nr:Rhodopsin, GQ-coupled [Toxocara canis]